MFPGEHLVATGFMCLSQLAQDELDDRSVVAQLKSAIQSGAIASGGGQLSVRDIDVENLEAAVQYAVHIGSKTQHANQLLATGQLVLALRRALLGNDMPAARDLLESVRGKVIAALAADEVQAVKAEIDNWMVISQLSSAISSGYAQVSMRTPVHVLGVVRYLPLHVCSPLWGQVRRCGFRVMCVHANVDQ